MGDGVSVAVVDDDPSALDALAGLVRALGFHATGYASAEDFLRAAPTDIDCLLSDLRMRGLSGLDLAARLSRAGRPVPTVLVTAYADDVTAGAAAQAGIVAILVKPVRPDDLEAAIRHAIARRDGRDAAR